jgi:putative FmdB family regulatory protein
MPLYEYRCKKCHHQFEILQGLKEKNIGKCPKCGGPLSRLISSPAIQFKGTGWYVTDYANKNSPPGGNGQKVQKRAKKEDSPASKEKGKRQPEDK